MVVMVSHLFVVVGAYGSYCVGTGIFLRFEAVILGDWAGDCNFIALYDIAIACNLAIVLLLFCSFGGVVTPILTFGVGAYFYGFAFMDYAVERKRFRVKESVQYMRHNAGMVTAVGCVFALSLMIPWASIVVCSFVSLLSVVAGTVVVERKLNMKEVENRKV